MPKIKTYLDSCALIDLIAGQQEQAQPILEIINDENREFYFSHFVMLETLPTARRNKDLYDCQEAMLEEYFGFSNLVKLDENDFEQAIALIAEKHLQTIDCLHVVAAKKAGCHELISTEKPHKSIYSNGLIKTTCARPLQ